MSEISTQIGQAIDTKPDTLSEAMLGLKRAKEALRESEERFRMVSELTSDWTYATRVKPDASVQIEWITEAFSRITGYTPQEVEGGSSWLDLIYPEDLLVVQRRVENLYSGRPDVSEYRIITRGGEVRWVRDHGHPLWDEGQERVVRIYGAVQDITEHKRAEEALRTAHGELESRVQKRTEELNRSNEALKQEIAERVRVEGALREHEKQLREVNDRLEDHSRNLEHHVAERTRELERRRRVAESLRGILTILNSHRPLDEILGYIEAEASRILSSDTTAIVPLQNYLEGEDAQSTRPPIAEDTANSSIPWEVHQTVLEGQPLVVSDVAAVFPVELAPESQQRVCPVRPRNGCRALLAVPLVVTGEVYGCLVLYYFERREFSDDEIELAVTFGRQAALAIENARLRERAEKAAVVEERGRLARELHDSVTQQLYSVTLLAEGWRRLAQDDRLENLDSPLTELGEIAQQALKEMRLLVHELRSPTLEEEGLLTALQQRLSAVERRAGVETCLVADKVTELPAPAEEGLYRIALEALNNALKHAAATSVTVHVRATDERVELEVGDNGQGFDTSTVSESGGLGLNGMRERAEQLNGALMVHSIPGQGTTVKVSLETGANPQKQ